MSRRGTKVAVGLAVVVGLALGGAAIARGSGGGDGGLTGSEANQARAAALAATGGGTVNALERDSEAGATYEVEVTRPDGVTVDVRLDERFAVVVIDGDSEASDADDGERG